MLKKIKMQHPQTKATRGLSLGLLTLMFTLTATLSTKAQLNPFQAVYFQNKYLINPSMAGVNEGLNVNLGYRQQWSSFPGTPKTQTLTADYQATERVGLGLSINNDKAGLIQTTRIMGTYAYRLPIGGDGQKLNFGISLGINDPYISNSSVNGDQTDVQIADYNILKAYVDGDFGAAYTDKHLTIEAAIPNLKATFFQTIDDRVDVDRNTFMTSASYKFFIKEEDVTLEPKLMMRGVKGFDDIFDACMNLNLAKYGISAQAVYHTTQSVGVGVALDQKLFGVNIGYNMETGPLNSYTSGTFEFGVKVKLFGK